MKEPPAQLVCPNQKDVLICIISKCKVAGGSKNQTHTHTRNALQFLHQTADNKKNESVAFDGLTFQYCKQSQENDELLCSCSKQASAALLHESYFQASDVCEVSHT